ncbi:unnamed protein product [Polarella glacialis]|uniref:Uncharacterized protein n=2 Tax=Polarella glacialis TaxID=89957 RepID=A0A813LRD4_POLGL|nr:unnamed protein product [Polarella glacialis]
MGRRGAAALEELLSGCRSCLKLRLKLEHSERARVKAQEQFARAQRESLMLRRRCVEQEEGGGSSPSRAASLGAAAVGSEVLNISTGALTITAEHSPVISDASAKAAMDEDVTRTLEGYRREVSLLQQQLLERSAREADLQEQLRQQRLEHDAAKQDFEVQVSSLLCDLGDLEAQNRTLLGASSSSGHGASDSGL